MSLLTLVNEKITNKYNIEAVDSESMDFIMESCPYCGGEVSEDDSGRLSCLGCGKPLYPDRADTSSFLGFEPAPVPAEDVDGVLQDAEAPAEEGPDKGLESYEKIMEYVSTNNVPLATAAVAERVEVGDDSLMLYMVRAATNSRMGEDGKALADWKAGLSRMEDVSGIDAFVCLMAKTTADLILKDELEFKEFDYIGHVDRMADMLDEKLDCSCKGHLYASVLVDYMDLYEALSDEGKETCAEAAIRLLRRVAVYSRDLEMLKVLITRVLEAMDYRDESYVQDDNFELRVFYVINGRIVTHTPELGMCDFPSGWTDADMKAKLEPYLDTIMSCEDDYMELMYRKQKADSETQIPYEETFAPLDKYLKRMGIEGSMEFGVALDDYVQRYMRVIV